MDNLTIPEQHTVHIARDTLRMAEPMRAVMGGPSEPEAIATLMRFGVRGHQHLIAGGRLPSRQHTPRDGATAHEWDSTQR